MIDPDDGMNLWLKSSETKYTPTILLVHSRTMQVNNATYNHYSLRAKYYLYTLSVVHTHREKIYICTINKKTKSVR